MDEHTSAAKEYYDSDDANLFYMKIWGGENIHIGFYGDDWSPDTVNPDYVRDASIKGVDVLIADMPNFAEAEKVADLGAGIGGTARRMCEKNDKITVDCYEISEKENDTNNDLNKKAGYSDRITVVPKSYTETNATDGYYDLIVSQDAFLHCNERESLLKEASRILKKGGYLVFTDPMQTDNADTATLEPIYNRLGLEDMCSPVPSFLNLSTKKGLYTKLAKENDLEFVRFHDLNEQMRRHYTSVKRILDDKGTEFGISQKYIEGSSFGLSHWVKGVEKKNLTWGTLVYQKK